MRSCSTSEIPISKSLLSVTATAEINNPYISRKYLKYTKSVFEIRNSTQNNGSLKYVF